MKVNVFWFRRDLRLNDNVGLHYALAEGLPVLPVFIFDKDIIGGLPEDDARVSFIHQTLSSMHSDLAKMASGVLCIHKSAGEAFDQLLGEYEINAVYANKDYEPAALDRDKKIQEELEQHGVSLKLFKDQVIFEEKEVLKQDGEPYTVYTPYMRKWRQRLKEENWQYEELPARGQFLNHQGHLPDLSELGFRESTIKVKPYDLSDLQSYSDTRNIPHLDSTSHLGPHLRFGTVSIRQIMDYALKTSETFANELIWREFFMQILFNFPHVVDKSFKAKYEHITWNNNEEDFAKWCQGETGYPIVDAGMRELNETGFMHNRVRMITASFLCKHLLIDWRWGEAYFAEKLLDYELASNNGNWQWVAGCGCDAAPYFRIFNPWEQQKKFDKQKQYIEHWVPEYETEEYPDPMIEHTFARKRALDRYAEGLKGA